MAIELPWPILGVVIPCFLITFCGYGTHYYIMLPMGATTAQQAWFQFSLTMTWISYWLAIKISPGSPPKDFRPLPGEWKRWCLKCNAFKPERAHHCKKCQKCVLKMDHHCPWTYNCVGHGNMPHFIRFLLWVIISTAYAFYHLILGAIYIYENRNLPSYMIPRSQIIMNIVLLPVVFFVMFTISLLTIRVFNDVLSGRTQIESWEIERVRSLVRRRLTRNVDFPYDIDLWTNLTDSWGPVFTWLLPWGNALGDGLHFRKNEAADGGAVWPPDHKDQESPSTSGTATYKPTFVNMIHARYRGNRHPGDPNEFYRREQWENFEGEKLTDFGVDMDAEPSDTPGVVVDYSLADDDIPLQSLLNSRAADINATSPAHDGTSIT